MEDSTPNLQLLELKLTSFKSYAGEQLTFGPRLNGITGLNGVGKTNLLDAVYYLCMGKSHFNLNDIHLARHGSNFFRLEGTFRRAGKKEEIVAKVEPRRRKEMQRNGLAYERLSDHVGFAPVVFIAPDDTILVREGSEERRRLLDNTLSQIDPEYLQHLITYNKVLRQRNALLKQFGEQRRVDKALLATYDMQLLEPAEAIHRRRADFVERFNPIFLQYAHVLSGHQEEVSCHFESQQLETTLEALLRDAREKDLAVERTTVGPHKDDLIFCLGAHPIKRYGSQGQVKTFVLALKLAQYELLRQEVGYAPLLLLDDIFDKLDRTRVERLLQLLVDQAFGQMFVTDTHRARLEDILRQVDAQYSIFEVKQGQARRLNEEEKEDEA